MFHKTLTFNDLQVTLPLVFEQMGYGGNTPSASVVEETKRIVAAVSQLLRPQFCYVVLRQLPAFELGNIITRQLRNSEAYACFICTSGQEFSDYQQRLKQEGDMVKVFIADTLGSVLAECCADCMEKSLQSSIDKLGWLHTNRFSPGYCGWHVSQQQLLFPLFGGETCGVQLTDSSLMLPIKSVSGIIGLGKKVRHLDYSCGLCNYAKCYKRKKKPLPPSQSSTDE